MHHGLGGNGEYKVCRALLWKFLANLYSIGPSSQPQKTLTCISRRGSRILKWGGGGGGGGGGGEF